MAYFILNCCIPCGTCPSSAPIASRGTKTLSIFAHLDGNGASTTVNSTDGCSAIPLKSGGSLSLSRFQMAGQGMLQTSVGLSQWEPGGAAGVFGFLPFMANNGGFIAAPYVICQGGATKAYPTTLGTIGGVTYYASATPQASSARYDSTAMQFIEVDAVSGDWRYFANNSFDPNRLGRIVKRVDRNINTVYYNYSAAAGQVVLRSLAGDFGNVSPYFYYQNESIPAPITKIVLVDKTNAANSRSIYYQYDASSLLTKATFPGGCTQPYLNKVTGLANASIAMLREVDAEGFTTYFEYTDSSYAVLQRSIEPDNRVTDFTYTGGKTQVALTGRTPTYYGYTSNPDGTALITRMRDALGNTTDYQYDAKNLKTRQADPNGNVTYFENDDVNFVQTKRISALNKAATAYKYMPNGQDLRAVVGPRNTAGLPVVTYYQYDARRNRTATIDALNNTTATIPDILGRLRIQQDARLNATYFNYNTASGLRQSQVDPNNQVAYFGYNAFADRTRLVSPRWRETGSYATFTTYHEYDNRDRRTKTIDALKQATTFDYTARGDLLDTVDARGVTTTNGYSGLRLLTRQYVSDTSSTVVQKTYFAYDIYKNRTKQVDPNGNATYFRYDALDRQTAMQDALKRTAYYAYDSVGNRVKMQDARINTTYYIFDQLSRQTAQRDPLGNTTAYGYDLADNRRVVQDARLNATYFAFDALDRMTAMVDAANGTSTQKYDAVGNVLSRTDALAHATYFTYDKLNRPSLVTNHLGNQTYYFYDAAGNRTKVRDQVVTTAYYFYDVLDRPSARRDGLGQATYFFYDAVGNRTRVRNARAHTTYFAYDALNRLTTARDALANQTYFGYDAVGNQTLVRDGLGHATASRYDAVNRLTAITDSLTASAYFGYDAVGNRTKERDQRQNTSYFTYDALNRLSTIFDPLGKTATYTYDATSNLHSTIDNTGFPTYFQYDTLNRRTRIVYAGQTAGYGLQPYGTSPYGGGTGPASDTQYFAYDAVGNLTTAIAAASTTSYRYDALNRVTRKTSDATSAYFTYVVRGDNQSFLDSIRYPNNVKAYYAYDAAHALAKVVGPTGTTTTYVRNPLSRPQKKQFGNSTVCYYAYDNAERTTSIRHLTSAGVGIAYFDYQYDAANRITRITRLDAAVYYAYDTCDRLTAETWRRKSTGTQLYGFQYRYDATGNRTKGYREAAAGVQIDTAYYVYDAANALTKRISSPSGTLTYYAYDANGSVTKILDGSSATYFTYGGNQLVTSIVPPPADGQPWQFAYDGQLSRRKIVKAGVASYYLWNGMNQLEERDAAGTLRARYTHGQPIVPGVGSAVEAQRITATTTYFQYLHMDHQGSIQAITNTAQATQAAYTNDAFGRQIVAPSGTNPAIPNDLVFQSNWITASIGTKRYGITTSRIYDFESGVFLQRDPLPTHRKIIYASFGNSYGIYKNTLFSREIGNSTPRFIFLNDYSCFISPNYYDPTGLSTLTLDVGSDVAHKPAIDKDNANLNDQINKLKSNIGFCCKTYNIMCGVDVKINYKNPIPNPPGKDWGIYADPLKDALKTIAGDDGGIPVIQVGGNLTDPQTPGLIGGVTVPGVGVAVDPAIGNVNTLSHELGHYAGYDQGNRPGDNKHSIDNSNTMMWVADNQSSDAKPDKCWCEKLSKLTK